VHKVTRRLRQIVTVRHRQCWTTSWCRPTLYCTVATRRGRTYYSAPFMPTLLQADFSWRARNRACSANCSGHERRAEKNRLSVIPAAVRVVFWQVRGFVTSSISSGRCVRDLRPCVSCNRQMKYLRESTDTEFRGITCSYSLLLHFIPLVARRFRGIVRLRPRPFYPHNGSRLRIPLGK
jgi:hypothetical protein